MVVDWQLANASAARVSTASTTSSSIHNGGPLVSPLHTANRWQRPLLGRYKCNIDAAFSNSLNRTGIGICIRDHNGSFVLAKTVLHPCFLPVDVGETLGLFLALQWLSDIQFDNVDFETDSKLTVDAFLSDRNDTSEFGCIITSCCSLFSHLFSNSRVELLGDKLTGLLMHLQETPHYWLVPLSIMKYPSVLNLLLSMKCYKQVSLNFFYYSSFFLFISS